MNHTDAALVDAMERVIAKLVSRGGWVSFADLGEEPSLTVRALDELDCRGLVVGYSRNPALPIPQNLYRFQIVTPRI